MIHPLLTLSGRAFGKLSRVFHESARRWEPAGSQQRAVVGSTRYDMMTAPDESYYAEQYWHAIVPHLAGVTPNANVLDLGCSQGRMSLRLAAQFPGGQVLGCDLSADAVAAAQAYAAGKSIRNVTYRVQPISECLDAAREGSVDVALMTEVTFFHPQWRDEMPRIARCLKAGGIAAISFRPKYFYGMLAVRARNWHDVETIVAARQGSILGNTTTFTWQTSAEVHALFAGDPALELIALRGIGVCSGIPGDPHDTLCRPSQLTDSEREQLMKLEQDLGPGAPDGGRYMLAIARKRATS